jgi:dCTP deaminase
MKKRANKRRNGVLPRQKILEYIKTEIIDSEYKIPESQVQPATLDLRVGKRIWRVPKSFLPGKERTVEDQIKEFQDNAWELSLVEGSKRLETDKIYVIELEEKLKLALNVAGRGNPKSTTGRLDKFSRLETNYTQTFESIARGYEGKLYLSGFPNSFPLIVERGTPLHQARLFTGENFRLNDKQLAKLYSETPLLYDKNSEPIPLEDVIIKDNGIFMSIDLEEDIVAYRAKKNAGIVDMTLDNKGDIKKHPKEDYWDVIEKPRNGDITLDPSFFYILKTKEKLVVPPEYSAEMVPYDEGAGEFRSHYAGFFDPGWGIVEGKHEGTAGVLEVRMRDVPMMIRDGQLFVKMVFEYMLEVPDILYGEGKMKSNYHGQGLKLAKYFE